MHRISDMKTITLMMKVERKLCFISETGLWGTHLLVQWKRNKSSR